MSDFDLSTLADLTDRPVASGVISSSDHEAWRDDVETKWTSLKNCLLALESNFSGASAPAGNTTRGKVWADTTNTGRVIWKGDPDGSGCDDEFLTRLEAWRVSLATAGTDTFKLSGVTQKNITENPLTSTGVLRAFTIAAGVLGSDGQALRLTAAIQKTGSSGTATVQVRFGDTPTSRLAFSFTADTTGAYYIEALIVRISATAVDCIGYALSEAEGDSVSDFDAATSGVTLGSAQTLDLNLSAISAGTVTFQFATVEILN